MKRLITKLANSKFFDVVGILIILGAVFEMGYYKTPLSASKFFTGLHGSFFTVLPIIGVVSTLSAIASVMSTRYVAKLNNVGNVIGWINTIFCGVIDFVLGNVGAILTYPISIYLNWKAKDNWDNKYHGTFGKPKNYGHFLALLILLAFVTSFSLNGIVYYLFGWGFNMLFYFSSVTFTLSLVADVLNVYKMPSQWSFWAIYNFSQLGKAIVMGNIANVAKYIYYIINSIVGGANWLIKRAEGEK